MEKGHLRRKIYSYALTAAVFAVVALPFGSAYAASSSYSFAMLMRTDGCANGEMHPLNAGTAHISGSTSSPTSSGIHVLYTLHRDVFGPNPSYGTVDGNVNTSFTGTFPTAISATGTNYCIEIWRGSSDGFTVTGSGTLYN